MVAQRVTKADHNGDDDSMYSSPMLYSPPGGVVIVLSPEKAIAVSAGSSSCACIRAVMHP